MSANRRLANRSLANRSLYDRASQQRRLEPTGMNEVRTTIFRQNRPTAAGTRDLDSCTTIVLVSPTAAIVAHVPPSLVTADGRCIDGDTIMNARMNEFIQQRNDHIDYFCWPLRALVYYADPQFIEGGFFLHEQRENVLQILSGLGINTADPSQCQSVLYKTPVDRSKKGQGTVLVDWKAGIPEIYVQNERLIFQGWYNNLNTGLPILRVGSEDYNFELGSDGQFVLEGTTTSIDEGLKLSDAFYLQAVTRYTHHIGSS